LLLDYCILLLLGLTALQWQQLQFHRKLCDYAHNSQEAISSTLLLSVQCCAWTECKLCVCLCVRHTFCQLAYSRQRIFTADSLKDADLCKDVPFGALDDELSHLWVQFCYSGLLTKSTITPSQFGVAHLSCAGDIAIL